MQATHIDAERRYEEFRKVAMDSVKRNLPYTDKNRISLNRIDSNALSQAGCWSNDPNRKVDWPWVSGYADYSRIRPKRFELALWYDSTLCSLSLGRTSYHGSRLRLDFLESRPTDCPLKGRVTPIVFSTAEVYAQIIGASELRVIDPIDDNLIEYYSSFGYKYCDGSKEKTKHYLSKQLL